MNTVRCEREWGKINTNEMEEGSVPLAISLYFTIQVPAENEDECHSAERMRQEREEMDTARKPYVLRI